LTPDAALPPAIVRQEAANDGAFRWKLASGFAAVVAVAAIGWNVWGLAGAPSGQQLAQAQPEQRLLSQPVPSGPVQPAGPGAGTPTTLVNVAAPDAQRVALGAEGDQPQMLRDPQLDRLLAAHRRMAAFEGSPAAFLRNATFEEPQR
jgi:sigma-E factor negative regulatory protein RseA